MAACYSMSSQAVAVRCICAARCVGQVVGQVVGQAEAAEQAEGGDGQVSFLTFRLQDLVAGGAAILENPENVLEVSFHPILPAVQSVIASGTVDISGEWRSTYDGPMSGSFQKESHEAEPFSLHSLRCDLHTCSG